MALCAFYKKARQKEKKSATTFCRTFFLLRYKKVQREKRTLG